MAILGWPLRLLLLIGSVVVFFTIWRCIKKREIQLKDGGFWIVFSFLLALISIFPILAVWISGLFGLQSPSNGVFLIVISLLGSHDFVLTVRLSRLEMKNTRLIQKVAIDKVLEEEGALDEKEDLLLFR